MKILDILSNLSPSEPYYTFEFFPPKTDQGLSNLYARLARMSHLHPKWVHVTWGAGGSTKDRSLELAQAVREVMNEELGEEGKIDVCLHLTCTNIREGEIEDTIAEIKKAGIQNILALRGESDPPRGEESWIPSDPRFQHAIDLVKYLKEHHDDYFCIGVAGYPEGWSDSSTHSLTLEEKKTEMQYLREKVDAGADFIVTQLFYDVEAFTQWHTDCRSAGIKVPILPGTMPIQSYSTFRRITKLCHVKIPPQVLADLEPIAGNDAKVKEYGISLAISTIRTLWDQGIRGFHFCTLNLERSVKKVLEGLEWVDEEEQTSSTLSPVPIKQQTNGTPAIHHDESSLSVSPRDAIRETRNRRASITMMEDDPRQEGKTTWDEFPNGRFGDARSPAYGEIDGWGVSLKMPQRTEATKLWGSPETESDISDIFISYLKGNITSIPWSDEPVLSETTAIYPHLTSLNSRKWWTVASQPAVDGISSSNSVYGFGPSGGYVYQKAFVELFIPLEDLERLVRRIGKLEDEDWEKGQAIKFFASNKKGEWKSNMGEEEVNAVTWAVFDGKEIATTTLIEKLSFKAWTEEAFALWEEWEQLYAPNSRSRKLLRDIGETRWLISIVHHDYKDDKALWNFLLEH
ncbi:MTHFR-domain-containing protein [Atractiella rhizophila]|nr:MTHFR-domain-containing protein [Atractiella rhizophila]